MEADAADLDGKGSAAATVTGSGKLRPRPEVFPTLQLFGPHRREALRHRPPADAQRLFTAHALQHDADSGL